MFSSMKTTRLFVAIFAALAMTVFVNARLAFSQDAADAADADSSGSVSGTSVDANWESGGPALDEDADTADKVLEIPQATCPGGAPAPCAGNDNDDDDADGEAINAPSPGAPPATADEDTANGGVPDVDFGTADEYANQQEYAAPYAVYPYPYAVNPSAIGGAGSVNRSPRVYGSTMASPGIQAALPLTQAALPLNQGAWVNSANASYFGRPAGSPMMGMMRPGPAFGFHH
jgi:hypothetical protein